jgi:hypothetical protein
MFRALFIACGVMLLVMGAECLVVEKVTLAGPPPKTNAWGQVVAEPPRVFETPEWAPWAMFGGGAVTLLYSFTIPKRVAGG